GSFHEIAIGARSTVCSPYPWARSIAVSLRSPPGRPARRAHLPPWRESELDTPSDHPPALGASSSALAPLGRPAGSPTCWARADPACLDTDMLGVDSMPRSDGRVALHRERAARALDSSGVASCPLHSEKAAMRIAASVW